MKICFYFTKQTLCNRSFSQADVPLVAYQAGLSFNMDLNSPFRWTPKIQKIEQTPEFLKKMKYFQRLTVMEDHHYSELIDTFLFEALKNTDFDYYYDYKCESNTYCPFYGDIPFLIYNKVNKYPIIPVMRTKPINAFTLVAKEREMLITEPVAAGLWALTNSQVQKLDKVRMLQTDGNHWRMLELCKNERFKKTGIYCQEKDSYSKIYYDYQVQQVILGLIRYSLNQMDEKEQALNLIYDFVDERRYKSIYYQYLIKIIYCIQHMKVHLQKQQQSFGNLYLNQLRTFSFEFIDVFIILIIVNYFILRAFLICRINCFIH